MRWCQGQAGRSRAAIAEASIKVSTIKWEECAGLVHGLEDGACGNRLSTAYSPKEPMLGGAVQGPWLELEVPSMGPNLGL